jgi:predicted ATPase
LLARVIYVGAPATPQKERFRTHEAILINEPAGGFDPSLLASLQAAVAKAREPVS